MPAARRVRQQTPDQPVALQSPLEQDNVLLEGSNARRVRVFTHCISTLVSTSKVRALLMQLVALDSIMQHCSEVG